MVNKRERSSPGESVSEKRNKSMAMSTHRGLLPVQDDEFLDAKEPLDTIFMDILKRDDETYLGADINVSTAFESQV